MSRARDLGTADGLSTQPPTVTTADVVTQPAAPDTWAPLRHSAFRRFWIAQFIANSGTWAQTVGGQWLMGDLGGGPLAIALIQTAMTLPVFLFVVGFGVLGDIVDRRRLLLVSHALMMVGAALLAAFTIAGFMTQALLLATTAIIGTGAALAMPTFSAIQPELVPREAVPTAALLNGAQLNVARAVGPAIGGILIAAVGPEGTFVMNALTFSVVLWAIYVWERKPEHRPLGSEHVRSAIVAGVRYVRSDPSFRVVLARTSLFILFASSLWALLPVVARGELGLSASGYGLLLAAAGLGAVVGAFVVPIARGKVQSNELVAAGTVAFAASLAVIGLSHSRAVVVAALAVAGLSSIAVMSSFGGTAQILLPNWTRARALAFFMLVFMGGQAIGSVLWGVVADTLSLEAAFLIPAVGLLAGPLAGTRWLKMHAVGDVRPARHWPIPNVSIEIEPREGPILIELLWRVEPDNRDRFLAAMEAVRRSRRRTGATLWGLFQDAAEPTVYIETFTTNTWEEHLRQHLERTTMMDVAVEEAATRFADEPPHIRHFVWAYRDEKERRGASWAPSSSDPADLGSTS